MIGLHGALLLTHVVAMIGLFSTLTIEGAVRDLDGQDVVLVVRDGRVE